MQTHRKAETSAGGMRAAVMSYRNILVFLDQDPLCEPRCRFAIQMARDLDCHLVGAAPAGFPSLPAALGLQEGTSFQDLGEAIWTAMATRARASAERFRTACRAAGLHSFEAIVDNAEEAAALVRLAHCSDLVILSQADPRGPEHRRAQALVEQVVMACGRPTLILPHAGTFASVGESVMVAWDDSREATRAVTDALPLLRCAEQVHVAMWNEAQDRDSPSVASRLDALHRWLLSHGVAAELHVESTEIDLGAAMLSRAADLGADLIVMGAYGHARWSERVLGGATRGLLTSMTVPVLMSH